MWIGGVHYAIVLAGFTIDEIIFAAVERRKARVPLEWSLITATKNFEMAGSITISIRGVCSSDRDSPDRTA
jgi:hypothetical protein